MDYRREIDGLRALAVMPVILFHAGFSTFSGGFVGVDVFFVISGYLITTIVLSELEQGKFSVTEFYERRARRILPLLFLVMGVCLPLAWFWLLPEDMKSFSQSLIAVPLFASNVLFWKSGGYFEPAVELKPLLHTWSLAVEEQFYLLFPLFLLAAWRLGRRWILAILSVTALVSLGLAQWHVDSKPAAVFYLLPTRGWELLTGSFVAFYLSGRKRSGDKFPGFVGEPGGLVGVTLILYAVLSFDKKTPFPSLYTLVPTLGAALVVLFASPTTVAGKLLGHKLPVGIGLLSYGAYLWHQPVFALTRHQSLEEPGPYLSGLLVMASLVLAYVGWRYVERPCRKSQSLSSRQTFTLALAGSLAFMSIGLTGYFSKGFEGRLSGVRAEFLGSFENSIPTWNYFSKSGIFQEYRNQCNFYDLQKYRAGGYTNVPVEHIAKECHVRNTGFRYSVMLWGDSHAQQLYSGLKQVMPDSWQLLQVASSGCEARIITRPDKQNFCNYSNWFAVRTVVEARPDVVVIAQYTNHESASLEALSRQLHALGVKKVVIVGPTPRWMAELPKVVVRLWCDIPRRTWVSVDLNVLKLDAELKVGFKSSERAAYVSAIDNFCDRSGCLVYLGDDVQDGITTWDHGHLTPVASLSLAKNILAREILSISED